MKSSGSKRRRLMSISSNVSPPWPDLPATFESLNDDTLTTTLEFVGNKSYKSFGGINKRCKEVYLTTSGMTKETFLFGYAPLSVIIERVERTIEDDDEEEEEWFERVGKGVILYNRRDVLEWALQQKKKDVLEGICNIAAEEGRINTLVEVSNNVDDEDYKRDIFEHVDGYAAGGGRLDVLKWIETKSFSFNIQYCAEEAAFYGQLHIIQWLKEERRLELDGELYSYAARGGQLHVMKWLREQGCPWDECIFRNAAYEGNMNILQWLHDEDCPWPNDHRYRVDEYHDDLKPEVVDWCRVNGYRDRVYSIQWHYHEEETNLLLL